MTQLECALGIIACLFALIALLPRWDEDWGDGPPDDGTAA
jgi:hypothetical protein